MNHMRLKIAAGILLVLPVIHTLIWGFKRLITPGMASNQTYNLWVHRNFLVPNGTLYCVLTVVLIGILVTVMWPGTIPNPDKKYYSDPQEIRVRPSDSPIIAAGVVLLVCALLAAGMTIRAVWDNDKDEARFYNRATTFHVPDIKTTPVALRRLLDGASSTSVGKCQLVSQHDVPSCIRQGTLDMAGWVPRVSSLEGARKVMASTSGENQSVHLSDETLTYLNGSDGQAGRWSAIRDGKGKGQPMEGVVEWTGSGQPTACSFTGDNAINRAFDGERGNSLKNLLAEKFPRLVYTMQDVWGYCADGKPIVVVPVSKQTKFKSRTVHVAAGILVIEGSPSGKPNITYRSSVKAGEFPGPVYSISLVAKQRKEVKWAAGRKNQQADRGSFGFDPANSAAQAGNNSEYLLQGATDKRLYWVTPLTPRTSTSELFVAYSITPADEVNSGQLNALDVYALADGDPRKINIDTLEASAKNYLLRTQASFIPNGGKLIEFTPTDGDIWRAFGELNGRVIFRLDISASNKITPQVIQLEESELGQPTAPGQPVAPGNDVCGKPLPDLNQVDLTNCAKQMVDELARRTQQQPVPAGK